ncbi:1-deoxy-D-xylulose-5-phosphate reductoisomerase [Eubacterium pyruvativorans]|uniref:1-deoxy-D-xylulose-5-phosphate reductoisomerase n=1 Tax=Eubacterium pyruvativorans TaxID=155865 RepID=UPI0023F58F52|nr:1-deoxy-D-xylulose-5-phosphate reductoisomerase [Eubacterium pyruvativorans]MCI5747186.1 1-deoxy-D-xylulose-5-phosphate reductoisomerase [Eubacterium pyruvativorans]MDD6706926.1 1-deoxy-D-xylulose-5-phosphate reductoisomerase [Eubacterium pyruvativorans]
MDMGNREKYRGERKRITVLGSTGSIGTQTLDVIRREPERFEVAALTCGRNVTLLAEQIREFHPSLVCCARKEDADRLAGEFPGIRVVWGEEGLIEAAEADCDLLENSLMGMRGLVPTWHSILAGHDLALANKETLVTGGHIIMDGVNEHGVRLLPVDSEHSAIFQCLQGNEGKPIRRILLTASGGPFRGWTREKLEKVTPEMALRHPNWSMGRKITIDSATMMNKGLEMIEAKWLFGVDIRDIQVLVHPQSILHSAVEFRDTSVIGQMGVPDMRIPISVALGYPDRLEACTEGLDFFGKHSTMTFEQPDRDVFKCLRLAEEASLRGGSYPVVMNAANEVLVQAFLDHRISFTDIMDDNEEVLVHHVSTGEPDLEDIVRIDRETREMVARTYLPKEV